MAYHIVRLTDMLDQLGESEVVRILSEFSCSHLNSDVEYYLKTKAIEFDRMHIAKTQIVFMKYKGVLKLVGYFTLSFKNITVTEKHLSKSIRKKIHRMASRDQDLRCFVIPCPLIAQIGKNYTDGLNKLITGSELLKMACQRVAQTQQDLGGKTVYLECEDKPKLIEFYENNGFSRFGERDIDRDETDRLCGQYLVQMLKVIT